MKQVVAVISLLHEAAGEGSLHRRFRGEPVLAWTLERVKRASRVETVALLAWQDQVERLDGMPAQVVCVGERRPLPSVEAVSVALRWADGWRGGLLGACTFDRGYHGPSIKRIMDAAEVDEVLLVESDAGLVDPALLDAVVEHAEGHEDVGYVFTPVAPGLAGILVRRKLVEALKETNGHPGRLLNYWPQLPGRDPIGLPTCAPHPIPAARTTNRFSLDSDRQLERVARATESLNGQLVRSDALELVRRMKGLGNDRWPREVTLEINTDRRTRAIFRPAVDRPPMSLELAAGLFAELGRCDDLRLTIAGLGDPLLHPQLFDMLQLARDAGIRAVHVETDLAGAPPDAVDRLFDSPLDLVSVHIPATSVATYANVMGVDALADVIAGINRFVARNRHLPLLVPTFVKCRENLHEMEAWYDYWLARLSAAVIVGPGDYAGEIPDVAVADMSPPMRIACRRLASRLTILSDGRVVPCEQDVHGRQALGVVGQDSIEEIWRDRMEQLRNRHACGRWGDPPVCANCREWHRP